MGERAKRTSISDVDSLLGDTRQPDNVGYCMGITGKYAIPDADTILAEVWREQEEWTGCP